METFDQLRAELNQISRVEVLTLVDVMALPNPLRGALTKFVKKGSFSLADLCAELALETPQGEELARVLVDKGFLRGDLRPTRSESLYRISLGRVRGRNIPIDL